MTEFYEQFTVSVVGGSTPGRLGETFDEYDEAVAAGKEAVEEGDGEGFVVNKAFVAEREDEGEGESAGQDAEADANGFTSVLDDGEPVE